jgi:hypothetical protein
VRDHDTDGRAGPHPFDGGQEAAGAAYLLIVDWPQTPLLLIASLCIVTGGPRTPHADSLPAKVFRQMVTPDLPTPWA